MPYKRKKDRKQYQKEYSTFKAKRNAGMRKAVLSGDFSKAKSIAQKKPKIHIRKPGKRVRKRGRKKG